MSDEILSRDQNHITVLGAITDDANQYVTMLRVDPTTKRLLVSAVAGSFAPSDATYITLSTNSGLSNERVLTAGSGITFVDGGAGGTLTINSSADLTVTLLDVSANSITAPNSIYNLTAGVPVIFKSSDANTMLYLDETNEYVGVGGTPSYKLHVQGGPVVQTTTSSFAAWFSTTEDTASTTTMYLDKIRATPTNNDSNYLLFRLANSAGTRIGTGYIGSQIDDITAGSVDSRFIMGAYVNSVAQEIIYNGASFRTTTNDQCALGSATISFSDLFLASGGVINWSNGNTTLTHSTGLLTSNVPMSVATSITSPLLIGGTGTTSTLTYKTTSGVGTTGADHIFVGGNNGATELMRISNGGELRVGIATTAASRLHVSDVTQTNGTTMSRFSSIGTTTDAANTVDTVTIANGFTASSATNQLLTRALFITSSNTITGGGILENQRGVNIQTNTAASTTTSNLTHIYLETGTTSGTVTNGYGLVIGAMQGTTKYGIYDAVGTNWVNATGGTLNIGDVTATTSCIATFTSTTGAVLFPRMTSTQRDALTPLAGMIIYNTTTSKFQGYNGAWVDFH